MHQTTPMPAPLETSTANIRALSSLTRRDAAAVRAAVRLAGGAFTVTEHDDYDGYLSFLLSPVEPDRVAYLVSGRTGAIDLAAILGDELAVLGTFKGIGAAMLSLRASIENGERFGIGGGIAQSLVDQHGEDAALQAAIEADRADLAARAALLRAIDAIDHENDQ